MTRIRRNVIRLLASLLTRDGTGARVFSTILVLCLPIFFALALFESHTWTEMAVLLFALCALIYALKALEKADQAQQAFDAILIEIRRIADAVSPLKQGSEHDLTVGSHHDTRPKSHAKK